jgi:molybdopterin-guanine dinucleotide biosynthesis protein A
MGADKALVQLAGRPLVAHALGILREAGLSGSIAGASSQLAEHAAVVRAPLIKDSTAGLGPLGGVCAAIGSCGSRHGVFLSVDLPLVPASLVALLLDHARTTGAAVTVASVNGFAQTFPAVVDRAALPALESALTEGNRGCFAAFQDAARRLAFPLSILPVEMLVQCGQIARSDGLPPAFWFQNLNTPGELGRAEAQLGFRHSVI